MINSDRNKGLRCPECGSFRLATLETRTAGKMIRRRKECRPLKHRFHTLEIPEDAVPDSAEIDDLFER